MNTNPIFLIIILILYIAATLDLIRHGKWWEAVMCMGSIIFTFGLIGTVMGWST